MNAATFATSAEKPLPLKSAVEAEISNLVAQERVRSWHAKVPAQIEDDAERIRSAIARLTSNSVDELEGLVSELQEVREFLKSEGERVQREIVNYAQLNHSALAAIKVITETIGPWKSTAVDGEAQDAGAKPPAGAREAEKRVPAAAANPA